MGRLRRIHYDMGKSGLFGNFFGSSTKRDFRAIRDHLFPIIKAADPNAPPSTTMTLSPEQTPVNVPVTENLLCLFGIDRGSHYEFIQQRQLPDGIEAHAIGAIAAANLMRELDGEIQLHATDFSGGYGFLCGGEHEAALIMVPQVWNIAEEKVGSRIVFGVPSKDLFVFVSAYDANAIAGLKAMIEKIHHNGDRLLSKNLFTYANGAVAAY